MTQYASIAITHRIKASTTIWPIIQWILVQSCWLSMTLDCPIVSKLFVASNFAFMGEYLKMYCYSYIYSSDSCGQHEVVIAHWIFVQFCWLRMLSPILACRQLNFQNDSLFSSSKSWLITTWQLLLGVASLTLLEAVSLPSMTNIIVASRVGFHFRVITRTNLCELVWTR
jgi:hypothetical protein